MAERPLLRALVFLAVVVVVVGLSWWLSAVLLPVWLGAVLALVLAPWVDRWGPKLGTRTRAIVLAVSSVVLVFGVLAAVAVPLMIGEVRHWTAAATGEGGQAMVGTEKTVHYGDFADPDLTQWSAALLEKAASAEGAPADVLRVLRHAPEPRQSHTLADALGDRDGDGRLEPGYGRQLRALQRDKSSWLGRSVGWLDRMGVLRQTRRAIERFGSSERLAQLVSGDQLSAASDVGLRVLGGVGDVLAGAVGVVLAGLLTPLYAFLLLLAFPKWEANLPGYLPHDRRDVWWRIGKRIVGTISAFVRGRVVVCAIVGVITAAGWLLMEVRLGLLMGLAVGALTLVPLANVLALVPVLLMSVVECATGTHGWGWLAGVVGVYALGQIAESVLNPLIVGDAVELALLPMILALTIGGAVAGFAGLVLAVPVAATLKILAEELWLPAWRGSVARPDSVVRPDYAAPPDKAP